MGLIVHLTDLHLGPKGAARYSDDDKLKLLDPEEHTSIRDVAIDQLKALASQIRTRARGISAIVVSGDVTVAGSPDGFAELSDFLVEAFGDLVPADPGRIVVVPGNHDVEWFA